MLFCVSECVFLRRVSCNIVAWLVALNCGGKRANTRAKDAEKWLIYIVQWTTATVLDSDLPWIFLRFFLSLCRLHLCEWVSDALSVQTARRTNYLTTQQQAAATVAAAAQTAELSIGNELMCTIVYAVRVTTFNFRANDKTVWRCGGKSRHQINDIEREKTQQKK